jgi:hypothetical protein
MGMVITPSEEPPNRDCMRCVSVHLLKQTESEPTKVWNDAGGGGRPGSVWCVTRQSLSERQLRPPQYRMGLSALTVCHA